ncbi:transcriptional activator domain-containing protein [Rhodococcus tukisamuensis]|uniref:Transcriptional activator domain-containing protein n=1 Tax=Rhodococcus tukisamuensis TaxID=168276 RepID=A0A1G6RES2_9NOCA|nr:transcriptional activator domain-containing protein [Rhodococcus tukisamuensis]
MGGNTNNVWLADDVDVDVHDFSHAAHRLLSETSDLPTDPTQVAVRPAELLPSWDEDWLMLAREQLRQLWMHALEASARRLLDAGMIPQAIDQLLVVVAEEPLRESAQALLIEAYLREGNMCEARRQLASFARQLWTVLRVRPSRDLCERVGGELNVERLR